MNAVIGIDGSESSFEALAQACRILSANDDWLTLYCSLPKARFGTTQQHEVAERASARFAETILDRADLVVPSDWKARLRRSIGTCDPANGLLNTAKNLGAHLLVVGTRGLGGPGRMLMGSVSRKVVRAATVPVLVVPKLAQGEQSSGLRILLACESLATGRQLVEALSRFSWPAGSHTDVIHVAPSILVGEGIPDWMNAGLRAPEMEEFVRVWIWEHMTRMKAGQVAMQTLCRELPPALKPGEPLVVEGAPDLRILEAARNRGNQLIVVGSKGSTPLERLMSGSTCESVLNNAPCSVLVIHHT
jgi:nucleotide-binding universal stress UspA family protein